MGTLTEMPSFLLQAEELQPGFSKAGRVYISKVNSPILTQMKSMYVDNILETSKSIPTYPLPVSWWYFSQVFTVLSSQCYRELGKNSEARQWVKLAMELPDVTSEVMLLRAFLTLGLSLSHPWILSRKKIFRWNLIFLEKSLHFACRCYDNSSEMKQRALLLGYQWFGKCWLRFGVLVLFSCFPRIQLSRRTWKNWKSS